MIVVVSGYESGGILSSVRCSITDEVNVFVQSLFVFEKRKPDSPNSARPYVSLYFIHLVPQLRKWLVFAEVFRGGPAHK